MNEFIENIMVAQEYASLHPEPTIRAISKDMSQAIELLMRLEDASENAVIAWGMGWDMEGVMENLRLACPLTSSPKPNP